MRRLSGRWFSVCATRLALATVISGVVVLAPEADPVATAAPAPSSSVDGPDDGADELAEAARTGRPVVVDSWTTETSEVSALPTGTFKAEISAGPVRVQEGDAWVDLDPTLRKRADGMLEPTVATSDVVLSGGGAAGSTLAQMSGDGMSYTVRTPFALPAPALRDDTAVYEDVLPNVDLVTSVSGSGFSFNWVVKSREAADDPRVRKLRLPVELNGLRVEPEHGGFSLVDGRGRLQLWTPTPTMWDSSGASSADPATGSSAETSLSAVDDGPDMADRVTTVATTLTDDALTLTPDPKLLDAPDVVFPVVIDPTATKLRNGWTAVWNNFPSKSFWQTEHSLGAGYEGFEQFKIVRSYFRFDTSSIRGKKVLGASLNLRQIHQASCQARPTDAYRTGSIGTGTTWNNQPARYTQQGSNDATVGCGSGTAMVGWDIKQGATALANANAATGTFMVRARDEGDKLAWKQFDDNEANIAVTFVSPPATPTGVTLKTANGYHPCGTSTAPTLVGSTTVTLGVRVSSADADSGSLRGVFARADSSAGVTHPDTSGTTAPNGQTSTLTWNVANGHVYRFRAKVWLVYTYNGQTGYVESGYSPTWCYFKIDTTAPPPPLVTTTAFTECASVETPEQCDALGESGTAGTFTISTTATDAVSYRWSLNGSAAIAVATSGGAARTISVTPSGVMNTLSVWSADGAGNLSLKRIFVFKVAPRSPDVQWSFDDPADVGADTGREQDAPMTLASATSTDLGRVGKGLSFTGGAPAEATGDGVSATTAFTVGAWFRLDTPAQGATTTLLSATDQMGNVFEFGYEPSTNSWTAGRRAPTSVTQVGWGTAVLHVWSHVAATFDPASKTLSLYINGRFAKSVVYPTAAWVNSQGWRIGCGRVGNTASSCGTGVIDEVNLYSSILGADEIRNLADPTSGEDDHPITAKAASWSMNDADDSAVAAESCYGADLTVANAPTPRFGLASDEFNRSLLVPDNGTQQVKLNRPVVDQTASFAVAVNVRPSVARSMVVAQQRGVNRESWNLAFERGAADTGRWVFQRTITDSSGASMVEVRSPVVADAEVTDELTVLVATYDRKNERIALFVNGVEFTQGPDPAVDEVHEASFKTPWAARGDLLIGSGLLNGASAPFAGEIERVDVYAGVFDRTSAYAYNNAVWE